jgi:KEOPS complex subunit Cgi121
MRVLTGHLDVPEADDLVETLAAVGEDHGCTLQAFDARYVADRAHLRRALALADRARDREEGIARDRAIELLLYAAGRRQIDRALAMGVPEGEAVPAAVVVAADPGHDDPERAERGAASALGDLLTPAEVDLGEPAVLREFFEVSEAELAATDASLADLVRERVALLVVER